MRSNCGILSQKGKSLVAEIKSEHDVAKCSCVHLASTADVWAANSIQKWAKFRLENCFTRCACVWIGAKEDYNGQMGLM